MVLVYTVPVQCIPACGVSIIAHHNNRHAMWRVYCMWRVYYCLLCMWRVYYCMWRVYYCLLRGLLFHVDSEVYACIEAEHAQMHFQT